MVVCLFFTLVGLSYAEISFKIMFINYIWQKGIPQSFWIDKNFTLPNILFYTINRTLTNTTAWIYCKPGSNVNKSDHTVRKFQDQDSHYLLQFIVMLSVSFSWETAENISKGGSQRILGHDDRGLFYKMEMPLFKLVDVRIKKSLRKNNNKNIKIIYF